MTRTAKHRATTSRRPALLASAVAFFATIVLATTGAFTPTAATSGPLDDPAAIRQACIDQLAARSATLTSAQRTWLRNCRDAMAPPSPTPTASPSGSPSASPTPSATVSPTATPTASPSPSPSPTAGCSVVGANTPGGPDPWGGCWPGPGNTGVPAGTTLTAYTGPCTITADNTVIDSKTVTCATLDIRAANVVIRRSLLQGTDVIDTNSATASFTITDSTVVNGAREQCLCIGGHDFTVLRVEVRGGNRSVYCMLRCLIQDSWLHGQQLQGAQHGSGLREEAFTTARHTVLVCDYPYTDDTTTLGCSADLTGYPDFAPIHDNTIDRNLFLASNTVSFCAYGGATAGKPFSGSPLNATNQRFTDNVFQRGANNKCGFYGPVTDFDAGRSGNVFSGNRWSTGELISVSGVPAALARAVRGLRTLTDG